MTTDTIVEKVMDRLETIKDFIKTRVEEIQVERFNEFNSTIKSLENAHNTAIQTCHHYGSLENPEVVPIKCSMRSFVDTDEGEVVVDYDAASFYAGYSMALGDVIDFLSKGNSEFNYPLAKQKKGVPVFSIYNLVKNRLSPA